MLQATNRLAEAEPLTRCTLAIDEASYGKEHPHIAIDLHNLASIVQAQRRTAEAEPLSRRHVEILMKFGATAGTPHPHLQAAIGNYTHLLKAMVLSDAEIRRRLDELRAECGVSLD